MSDVLSEKLARLSQWEDSGKPTERYERRADCTMEELRSFHDALKPFKWKAPMAQDCYPVSRLSLPVRP